MYQIIVEDILPVFDFLFVFSSFEVVINFTRSVYNVKENEGNAKVGISVTDGAVSKPVTVRYAVDAVVC